MDRADCAAAWQDVTFWTNQSNSYVVPPGIAAYSAVHYSNVQHQHKYRTHVEACYNGCVYGGSATSSEVYIP